MGYRQYFYAVEKTFVEQVRQCKTNQELYNLCRSKNIWCQRYQEYGEDSYHCPLYHWGKEIYEFGKYYENWKGIQACGTSLFTEGSQLSTEYQDYDAYVVSKDAIKSAIEFYRDKVIEIYRDLLREKSSDKFNKQSQFDRLRVHARDYLVWWERGAYDLSDNTSCIVHSWLYEHAIFELVRIYKTFDFNKYELMFMGW